MAVDVSLPEVMTDFYERQISSGMLNMQGRLADHLIPVFLN